MSRPPDRLLRVLAEWLDSCELGTLQVTEIARGLSGARLWRVEVGQTTLCLRRWPRVHPNSTTLAAIHALIAHVWQAGLTTVPLPRESNAGNTFQTIDNHIWELTQWMQGCHVENPSEPQTAAAMQALARFHRLSASFTTKVVAPAPGLETRLTLLKWLRDGHLAELEQAIVASARGDLRNGAQAVARAIRKQLHAWLDATAHAASVPLPLQWCLRDVHCGNLLFTGDEVTGLVDFGAAAVDSVAGDIARLLGSLTQSDTHRWRQALAAYEAVRPLATIERQAIPAYEVGGTIAAAANWLRWLFVEARNFADAATTQNRLVRLSEQLRFLETRVK